MISTIRFAGIGAFALTLALVAGWDPISTGPDQAFAAPVLQDAAKPKDEAKKGAESDPPTKTDPKKAPKGKKGTQDDPPTKTDPKKTSKDAKDKDGDEKKSSGTAALLNKNTKKSTDKNSASKNPYVKLRTVPGEISSFEETGRVLTLKVTEYAIVPRIEGKMLKGEVKTKDHQLKVILTDDVKIRVLNPPPLFDDKGKPRRYTAKELKELRGEDTKTPGFPSDIGELVPRSRVQVDLVLKKEDYQRLRSKKKTDEPLPEVPSTNLVIVVAPPPPNP